MEEQAGVREIHLMAVWRKGGKDEREGGSDNGEILSWRSGAKSARSLAREERAVERQILGRSNGMKKQDAVILGLYPEPCKFFCLFLSVCLLKVFRCVFNVIKSG